MLDYDGNIVYCENVNSRKAFLDTYETKVMVQNAVTKEYPYKYILKDGTTQDRIAKVFVERGTWGMKWFPFIHYIRTNIVVNFNEEIGERVNTWKGGCIGCGYLMLKGETPVETLKRMERDRKF